MKNIAFADMEEIRAFLAGNKEREFEILSRQAKYEFTADILTRLSYGTLRKKEKGEAKECLQQITGYGTQQMKRLIKKWKKKGLRYCKPKKTGVAVPRYKAGDVALLIKTDIAHKTPNGNAARAILQREFLVFGKKEYEKISGISVGHIYNIRKHKKQYLLSDAVKYSKTVPVSVNIGERRKPEPNGEPGFLRVDSVHQGDFDKEKGVYHINIVDEVTQFEIIGCVENLTDEFMIPLLEKLIEQFPFVRRNHIPKKNAGAIENFYETYFNPYLCFHRISAFAADYADKRGKIRKKYEIHMTPYERLKSLPNAEQYLKTGISFEELDKIAYAQSDNEFAEKMEKAKKEMLKNLKK